MTTFFKQDSFPKEPSRGCKDPTNPLLYTQPCLASALSGCAQLHITPLCSLPVPNPSLVWKGWTSRASKDILQMGQASDSSQWCEQQIWCQEQLTVHCKKRYTNPLDFSTKLALVTSPCHRKEIGNPSPPWTGQNFFFDFSLRARKPFCTSKDNWALTMLPWQQVKMGTLWFQRVWHWEAAFGCSPNEWWDSFPDKTAMNSICPLECKEMVLTANPPLPAGGQLVGSRLQLRASRLLPLWDTQPGSPKDAAASSDMP